jgi:hypothetical protein
MLATAAQRQLDGLWVLNYNILWMDVSPNEVYTMDIRAAVSSLFIVVLLATVSPVSHSAPAKHQNNEVFWWWGDSAGSSRIVRTHKSISGNAAVSMSNELGSAHGLTATMWLVVFNDPEACATIPCSEADLFNPAVKPDVLYAAGNVVGGSEKTRFGYHRNAGDNSGSIAGLFGMPTDNGDPWGLIDAKAAEVHYVIRVHGPLNPDEMPAQIHTYGGGCIAMAPFGYLPPTHPGDLFLGWGDCQDIMFAINQP